VTAPVNDPTNTASIGDLVYIDANENGQFDTDEVGLAGVGIQLIQGSTVIDTQTTDANGNYTFSNLAAGDYAVELQTDTLGDFEPPTNASVEISLADDETNNDVDFGVNPVVLGTGLIESFVFEDINENGFMEHEDQGLAGINIDVLLDGQLIDEATTDQDGKYSFQNLQNGDYTVVVSENLSNFRYNTTANSFSVSIVNGGAASLSEFGISAATPPSISLLGSSLLSCLWRSQVRRLLPPSTLSQIPVFKHYPLRNTWIAL
jgi:uncharacterized surface anchored protein